MPIRVGRDGRTNAPNTLLTQETGFALVIRADAGYWDTELLHRGDDCGEGAAGGSRQVLSAWTDCQSLAGGRLSISLGVYRPRGGLPIGFRLGTALGAAAAPRPSNQWDLKLQWLGAPEVVVEGNDCLQADLFAFWH